MSIAHPRAPPDDFLDASSTNRRPPRAPLLADSIPGFDVSGWFGLCGPPGLPPTAVSRWEAAVRQALQDRTIQSRLHEAGLTPRFEDSAAFARTLAADREKWGRVIREANIRAE